MPDADVAAAGVGKLPVEHELADLDYFISDIVVPEVTHDLFPPKSAFCWNRKIVITRAR